VSVAPPRRARPVVAQAALRCRQEGKALAVDAPPDDDDARGEVGG
jgi:hypothetical protein